MSYNYNFNKLFLGQDFIEYTFHTNLSKLNLPNWCEKYYYYGKCYTLTKKPIKMPDYYVYKMVMEYNNFNMMTSFMKDIEQYLIKKNTILHISNNKCENIINKLVELNCFVCIIFGKKFWTHNYVRLKEMIGVQYVIYNGTFCENLENLPPNLKIIKINIEKNVNKLLNIPLGTKKMLIYNMSNYVNILEFENIDGIKKVLYISSGDKNIFSSLNNVEYEYLVYNNDNSLINFANLSNSIKIIKLKKGFDKTLDYLPNSVEKIIFNGRINSTLYNLPSSVKEVYFNFVDTSQIKIINELPSFIEIIHIDCNHMINVYHCIEEITLVNVPKKIKELNIIVDDYRYSTEKYTPDNNKFNFTVNYLRNTITTDQNKINQFL